MKKLAILVLALVMCLTAVSAMAATVAKVGEQTFDTTKKAINYAITLPKDQRIVTIVGAAQSFTFVTGKDYSGLVIEGTPSGKIVNGSSTKGFTANSGVDFSDITIKNLTFEGGGIIFSQIANAKNFVVQGCTFIGDGSAASAIKLLRKTNASLNGVQLVGNTITGPYAKSAIELAGNKTNAEDSVDIIGNTISGAGYNAIQATYIANLSIVDNKISGGNGDAILNVKHSDNVYVVENDITMAKDDQIVLDNVTGVAIYDKSNALKDKTGATVQMDKQYVASGNDEDGKTWKAADNYVAINPEYNGNGQYVGGIFVGQPTAFADEIAGDLVYDGANNRYVLNKVTAALGNLPQTGDAENLMMWVALMAMAMVGLVAARKMSRQ